MDFDIVLQKRKSVRQYLNKEVKIDDVVEIIKYANMAPSARNRQPWKFILVDHKIKNKIADYLYEYISIHKNEKTGLASANIIQECSTFILVLRTNLSEKGYASDLLSIGAAVENACLKATEMGIDSLWVCDLVCISDYIKQLLMLDYPIVSSLCLGYKKDDISSPDKKGLQEIFQVLNCDL